MSAPSSAVPQPDGTGPSQILMLTIALVILFTAGMVALGYEWLVLHNQAAEAGFSAGWGLIIATMGVLLRELTARGL